MPYVSQKRGESTGLVGFDRVLTDEDIAYVREKLTIVNGKNLTWELTEGSCGPSGLVVPY